VTEQTDQPTPEPNPNEHILQALAAQAEKHAALNRRIFGIEEADADGERIKPVERDDEGEAA
jgi:hypothetical protein